MLTEGRGTWGHREEPAPFPPASSQRSMPVEFCVGEPPPRPLIKISAWHQQDGSELIVKLRKTFRSC